MPTAMEIILGLPENEKIHQAMGSILQGALMEMLDVETAKKLHDEGLRPYSQCVYFDKNKNLPIWRVNVLNDWAIEKILAPLTRQRQIFLHHKNYSVNLLECKIVADETYENMAERFMSDAAPTLKSAELEFLTASSFRRAGQYVIFPEMYLIIQSLLNRWNYFSVNYLLEEDLPQVLATFCRVKEYNLYSQLFLLEHQKINGFSGKMSVHFEGNRVINNLLAMLFEYGNYSGVGIKTALGMGAVKTSIYFNSK